MYNVLLVSTDSGFKVQAQKFVPYTDSSIGMVFEKSARTALEVLDTDPLDAIVFDHSENNDIRDLLQGMKRSAKSVPIVMVSKGPCPPEVMSLAINEGISAYVDRGVGEPTDYFREICSRAVLCAERYRIGADRTVNERRLEALIRMAKMSDRDFSEIVNYALDKALELTRSEIGYVALYERDRRVLRMLAWSRGAMRRCDMTNYPVEFSLDTTGVWGDPIRSGKSVTINNYEGDRRLLKKGVPEGHIPLRRLLMVPLFAQDGGLIGTAGVGNKATDYTSSDETQLNLLMGEVFTMFTKREELKRVSAPAQVVREITEVGQSGIAFITMDMDLAFLNRMGFRALGVDPSIQLPTLAEDVKTPQMQTVLDIVNRLRTHGGPSQKGGFSVRIAERNRNYSVTAYSTAGMENAIPGFTVFMEDVTELKRIDEAASRMKEHVSIIEGPVLDSLLTARPHLLLARPQLTDDKLAALDRINETMLFMSDYRNVGMMNPIWIDLEDAVRSAKNLCVPAEVTVNSRTNGIRVLADPALPTVFRHLFTNSLVHGGYVTEISIRCSIIDGALTIVYEDNGAGIDREVRPRMFNLVYSGHFGLFLVYNIVSVSGFSIRSPETSHGAVFEITVPPSKYSLG